MSLFSDPSIVKVADAQLFLNERNPGMLGRDIPSAENLISDQNGESTPGNLNELFTVSYQPSSGVYLSS